MQASATEIS